MTEQGGEVLDGLLVVELGTMVTAPLAGMMLADLGARVIKVELPETGDPFRAHGGGRYSPPFVAYNRGKESVHLDLRSAAGLANLRRLLARADVLLENFRPGVMDKMGLGDKALAALNPRLIRASITGFGKDGPYRDRPAYDSVPLAISGLASLLLDPADPHVSGPTIADNVTGMYATQGILAALLRRGTTGIGSQVEVNMLEAAIAFIPDAFAQYTRAGLVSGPETRVRISQSYALRTADDHLVAIHFSSVQKFWEGLLKVIARPDLATDERFVTPAARTRHYGELRAILMDVFATRTRAEWVAALSAEEVPGGPVNSVAEVADDPQVRHLGTFARTFHPAMGEVVGIKSPIRIDGARRDAPPPPPVLNADATAIAAEFGFEG